MKRAIIATAVLAALVGCEQYSPAAYHFHVCISKAEPADAGAIRACSEAAEVLTKNGGAR